MNKERGNVLVIILGIVLILFVIGFFRSQPSFWGAVSYKKVLNLPCGLTVDAPKNGDKAAFPIVVDGYINGCGWDPAAASAGTAQVFDGKGLPLTKPIALAIPSDSTNAPYYFSASLPLIAAPSTAGGNILIRANSGLLYSVPVAF